MASPWSLTWLEQLKVGAGAEVEADFYAATAAAEAARDSETTAARRLQACWRGRTTRLLLAFWAEHALKVERVTRGHLGRQTARRLRIERDLIRQRAFFDAYATAIQLRFRGFHSRKFLHNFYARKAYVTAVVQKGEEVSERAAEQESTGRETVSKLATRLHHLRSTASCAGIYNSPYHVGYHPTAFGVAVEEHLRNAVRPTIKRELAARGRSLKPVGSLPPIMPRNTHQASYNEMEAEERQERWLSKTKRMGQEDFVTTAGKLPLNYPGSVHVSTGYNPPPQSLERSVDKSRWVSEHNFKPAVPTNRLLDPARPLETLPPEKLTTTMPVA